MEYGRKKPGLWFCSSPRGTDLSDEVKCTKDQNDVTTEVKGMCETKNSCNFTLNKQTFPKDGCPSVYKYMVLYYRCGKPFTIFRCSLYTV